MSIGSAILALSTFPVFFDCMVFQIMPLKDPVEGLRMVSADGEFSLDPRMAEMLNVASARGSWVSDRWEIAAPTADGGEFQAFFMPSDKDEQRFGLDWTDRTAANTNGDRLIRSSGIADCRVVLPATEGKTK